MNYKPGAYPLGSGSVDSDPWPGGIPQDTAIPPPASGSADLSLPAGTTARPNNFQGRSVAQWRSPKAHPVVVILQPDSGQPASLTSPFLPEPLLLSQVTGNALGTTGQPAAVVRVTYGVGNAIRVLEADARAGSYQLPPCDFASIDAIAYGLGPQTARLAAAIVPGALQGGGARFTSTFRPTIAPGANVVEKVPFGARWVSLAGGGATGIGAGNPRLRLAQVGGAFILQDYETGNMVGQSGQPIELADRSVVTVYNDGAVAALLTVKFYLEV